MARRIQEQRAKSITLRIPQNLDEKAVKAEIEKMMEMAFGCVKIDTVRERMGIKKLKMNVYRKGDESALERLRKAEKMRASMA